LIISGKTVNGKGRLDYVVRPRVRLATIRDLDLLVRHRRAMFAAIDEYTSHELDAADRVYRRWMRTRIRSGRLAGFIVEVGQRPVASGCVWLMEVQPRPRQKGTTVAYLLSMFTEPDQRGMGHATRIVDTAMAWARDRGISRMTLHASPFGESVYRRLGFARTTEMIRTLMPEPHSRANRREPRSPPLQMERRGRTQAFIYDLDL
jgi:GNAT superfamily N-acetyltransferase